MNTHGPHELPHWRPDDPAVTYAPTGREKAAWVAWAIVSVPVAWALRRGRAYLTTPRPTWHTLAHVAFALFCGVWAYRGLARPWAVTVGATRAEASSVPFARGPLPLGTEDVERARDMATAAHDAATATARAAYGPGGMVMPVDPAGALDDGSPPSWLSAALSPYWGDIAGAAHERGMDSHWLALVIQQENPQAKTGFVSFDGGHGIGQIQRETAALIESQSGLPCTTQWADATVSIRCAAFYFRTALDNGASLATASNPEPMILMGVAGYNSGHSRGVDSAITRQLRRALESGADDPCAAIGNRYTAQYCRNTRERWSQTLRDRSAIHQGAMLP